MFDIETISAIAFVGVVIALIIIDRKNIEFKQGLIMRRTGRGKKWLYDVSKQHHKLIHYLTTAGVVVGFIVSIITFIILGHSVYNMFANPQAAIATGPSSRLILPSLGGVQYPNFILGVPIWFWLIGIFVVVSVHEPFHAFAARLKNVTIKSLGLALLFIFPIAFVEPDDKQIKKLKPLSKMRIYAAGSFANLLVALLAFFVIAGIGMLSAGIFATDGVRIASVVPGLPAQTAGLHGVISAVNGQTVSGLKDFTLIMGGVVPNQTVSITTDFGTYAVNTVGSQQNSSKAIIGIDAADELKFAGPFSGFGKPSELFISAFSWIGDLFAWLFIINLGVGSLNLLPVRYLDGGYLYETLLQRFFSEGTVRKIITALSIVFIFMIVMSLFGPSILGIFIGQ